MAAWDQPASDARASLQGESSGGAKPGELGENVSAVERRAMLLQPASLLQNRWGCQPT